MVVIGEENVDHVGNDFRKGIFFSDISFDTEKRLLSIENH